MSLETGIKSRNTPNNGSGWSVALAVIVLSIMLAFFAPLSAIAEGEETPGPGLTQAPAEAPANVVVPPTEVPTAVPVPPTAVPTAIPVPPTAVPVLPTAVPPLPTAVLTMEPTAVPTVAPTIEPTAVPTEKPVVWVNTDSLRITDGVTTHTLQQGGTANVSITYAVTTPRSSTTVYAQLIGAPQRWSIASTTLGDTDPAATTASWTESATRTPGTSFTMPIVITAPATVAQDQSVTLQLWSTAAGENGQEIGVAKTDLHIATITVLAPPPTPTVEPTIEPTAEPTAEPIATPTEAAALMSRTDVGVMGVSNTSCLQTSDTDEVSVDEDEYVEFQCDGHSASVSGNSGKWSFTGLAYGWEYRWENTSVTPAVWVDWSDDTYNENTRVATSYRVQLRPKDVPGVEPQGKVTVSLVNNQDKGYTVTLTATLKTDPTTPVSCSLAVDETDIVFDPLTWTGSAWSTNTGERTINGSVTSGQPGQTCTVQAWSAGLSNRDENKAGHIGLTVEDEGMSQTPVNVHTSITDDFELTVTLDSADAEDEPGMYEGTINFKLDGGE